MLKLDDRDMKILAILRAEGRIAKAELARRVNLSAAPCWERLQRLEKAGIITGYHADVALKKFGPHIVVFMAIELDQHRAKSRRGSDAKVRAMAWKPIRTSNTSAAMRLERAERRLAV